jgi:hypothetical protein
METVLERNLTGDAQLDTPAVRDMRMCVRDHQTSNPSSPHARISPSDSRVAPHGAPEPPGDGRFSRDEKPYAARIMFHDVLLDCVELGGCLFMETRRRTLLTCAPFTLL